MSCDEESLPKHFHLRAESGPLKFQMKLASDPRLLSIVRSAVSELAASLGFEDAQCRRITLAVDEALCNLIRHAYKNDCNHEIELYCEARADGLEFDFIDRGEPVDPARICAQPLDKVALGGRGTHIIREVMDSVIYERLPEGNRLRLTKYMPGTGRKL